MKKNFNYLLLGMVTLSFFQCTNEEIEPIPSAEEKQPINKLLESDPELYDYLSCQGFDLTDALIDGEYVVLEGDMVIKKSEIKNTMNASTNARVDQYVVNTSGVVNYSKVGNINYHIHYQVGNIHNSSISGNWPDAIRSAISDWNNIPNSKIKFTEVASIGSADIVFYTDDNLNLPNCMRNLLSPSIFNRNFPYESSGSGQTALGEFPSGGNPGRYISINSGDFSFSQNNRISVIRHAIGHNLGFRHDNPINGAANESTNIDNSSCGANSAFGANKLGGTPTSDGSSVMYYRVGLQGGTATGTGSLFYKNYPLSSNDKKAASFLYPFGYLYPFYPYNGPMIQSITKYSTFDPLKKDIAATLSTPTYHYYRYKIERFNQWSSTVLQSTEYSNASAPTFTLNNVPHGTWRFRITALNYKGDVIINGTMMTYTVN